MAQLCRRGGRACQAVGAVLGTSDGTAVAASSDDKNHTFCDSRAPHPLAMWMVQSDIRPREGISRTFCLGPSSSRL